MRRKRVQRNGTKERKRLNVSVKTMIKAKYCICSFSYLPSKFCEKKSFLANVFLFFALCNSDMSRGVFIGGSLK